MSCTNPTWQRHDWQRFVRHDAHRFMTPDPNAYTSYATRLLARRREEEVEAEREAELKALNAQHLQVCRELADLKFELAFRRIFRKYDPNQPRVPAGNPDGGQWTSDAGKDGSTPGLRSNSASDELSASRRVPGSRARGHHYVPKAVYKHLPLSPEARKVFREESTGRLSAQRHGWSEQHDRYNQAVGEALDRYMMSKGIRPDRMTGEQAREFANIVKRSTDSPIRDLNLGIFRRELLYLLRFRSRRGE